MLLIKSFSKIIIFAKFTNEMINESGLKLLLKELDTLI